MIFTSDLFTYARRTLIHVLEEAGWESVYVDKDTDRRGLRVDMFYPETRLVARINAGEGLPSAPRPVTRSRLVGRYRMRVVSRGFR